MSEGGVLGGFLEQNDRVAHVGNIVVRVYPLFGLPCLPQLWMLEDLCNLTSGYCRLNRLELVERFGLPHLVGEQGSPEAAAHSRW